MRLAIDTSDVPEDKRDAKFEEAILQFRCQLGLETRSLRWLFRLALHEGAHLRYQRKMGGEVKLRGPRLKFEDGKFTTAEGGIVFSPNGSIYDQQHQLDCFKLWLAGPLAVTTFTGESDDAEPDTLAVCKHFGIPRDKTESWILLAQIELWEDLQDAVVVREILDAAREYARAIFHDDSCDGSKCKMHGRPCVTGTYCTEGSTYHGDFCVDWGIKRYRIGDVPVESVIVSASA